MKVDNFVLLIISIVTLIVISLLTECNRGRLIELENNATKEIVETFFHVGSADRTEPGQWGYQITGITEGKYGGRSRQQVLNKLLEVGNHNTGDYISESEKQQYGSGLFDSTISETEKNPVDCNLEITTVNYQGLTPYHRVRPINNYSYGGSNCQTIYGPGYTYDPPSGQYNTYSVYDIPTIFGLGGCEAKSLKSIGVDSSRDIKLFEVGGKDSLLEKINIDLKTRIKLDELEFYTDIDLTSKHDWNGLNLGFVARCPSRIAYVSNNDNDFIYNSVQNLINTSTDTEYEIFYNITLDRDSACDERTGRNILTIEFIKRKKSTPGSSSSDEGLSLSEDVEGLVYASIGNTDIVTFGGQHPGKVAQNGLSIHGDLYRMICSDYGNTLSDTTALTEFFKLYKTTIPNPTQEEFKETVKQVIHSSTNTPTWNNSKKKHEEILYKLQSDKATINPGGNNNEIEFLFYPDEDGYNYITSESLIINNSANPKNGEGSFKIKISKNSTGSAGTHKIKIENNSYKQKEDTNEPLSIIYENTAFEETQLGQLRNIINTQLINSYTFTENLVMKTVNYNDFMGNYTIKGRYCGSKFRYTHFNSNGNITYDYSELSLPKLLNIIDNDGNGTEIDLIVT
jgi:hypothetical protein